MHTFILQLLVLPSSLLNALNQVGLNEKKKFVIESLMSFKWSCCFTLVFMMVSIFVKWRRNLLAEKGYEVFPEWIHFKADAENRE